MKKSKYDALLVSGACFASFDTIQSGWLIYDINEDFTISGYTASGKDHFPRKYKIQYSSGKNSRPFFRAYGRRLYLDNFYRCK